MCASFARDKAKTSFLTGTPMDGFRVAMQIDQVPSTRPAASSSASAPAGGE
jgi:hypothetical protein